MTDPSTNALANATKADLVAELRRRGYAVTAFGPVSHHVICGTPEYERAPWD